MSKLLKLFITFCLGTTLAACSTMDQYTSGFGTPTPQHIKQYKTAGNLWTDMARNFDLPDETADNPEVAAQIDWDMHHKGYLRGLAEKAKPWLYFVYQQVKKRGLPAEVALMPMIESAYNPFAINNGSGAAGLWQMMPGTASGFGLHVNWWYDGRRDVVASTNAALDYMAYLGNFFNNNWFLAMAAYDTGEGNVQNAVERNAREGKSTDFWALNLPIETQNYVPKILALATIISHPYIYPVKLPYIRNAPYLAAVNVGSQIDLARAARMAGISLSELSALNPGYNRWATSPTGPFVLIIPVDKAARFERELKKLPIRDRVTWNRIKVKSGDSLNSISREYRTSVSIIKQVNKLHGNMIRLGQILLIPSQRSALTDIVIDHEKHYFRALHHIPEPDYVHVVIQPGENLWTIAKRYHVSLRQIKFWNNIHSNFVSPGRKLIIWPPKPKKMYLYYTSWPYRVRKGDSLLWLAHRYHVDLRVLQNVNHLKSSMLHVGQLLYIPVAHYSTRPHHSSVDRHIPTHHDWRHRAKASNADNHNIYVVSAGDNLNHISKVFDVSVSDIKHANHLRNNNLRIGQKLIIPSKTPAVQHHHATHRSVARHTQHEHSDLYIVKSGDNLNHIARKFGVTVTALKLTNHLANDNLHIGQKIAIPARAHKAARHAEHHTTRHKRITEHHYTVKSGDDLYHIARRYHVTAKEIMEWNHIRSARDLRPGQKLLIKSS